MASDSSRLKTFPRLGLPPALLLRRERSEVIDGFKDAAKRTKRRDVRCQHAFGAAKDQGDRYDGMGASAYFQDSRCANALPVALDRLDMSQRHPIRECETLFRQP